MDGTAKETKNQWTLTQTENTFEFISDVFPRIKLLVDKVNEQSGQKTEFFNHVEEQERKVQQKLFKVAVMGPIKCGKSTFLNCILQASILPEGTLPQTAGLVSIVHCANLAIPQLFSVNEKGLQKDYLAEGEQEIYNYLKDFNAYLRGLNKDPSTPNPRGFPNCHRLLLKAQIPALNNFNSDFITFSLIDTPGYNEAKNPEITQTTQLLLRTADAIVYLLDITKLCEKDEFQFLSDVVKLRFDLLKDNRFFFLYNKADMDEENPGEVRNYIRGLLQSISPEMVEIEETIGCTVSSRKYLSSTFLLSGKANQLPKNHYNWITSQMFGTKVPQNFPQVIC